MGKLCKFIVSHSKTVKTDGKKEKKEKKEKKSKKSKKEESEDEIEWYTDVTEAAVEARALEAMTGQLADLVAHDSTEAAAAENTTQEADGATDDDKSGESAEEPEPEPAAASCNPAVQNVLDQLCAALDGLTKSKEINKAWTKFAPSLQEAKLSAEDAISLVMNLPDHIA